MPRERPLGPEGGVAVLRGNLAPDGAVIKHTAADRRLLQHAGPAVVFRDYNDLEARIDDPDAAGDGRLGAGAAERRTARRPGHARVGHAADPEEAAGAGRPRHGARLRRADERHQLRRLRAARRARSRSSAARSRFVRDGDIIELDVPARRLSLRVDDEELARRREQRRPPAPHTRAASGMLYSQHVTQADRGCDFDFLEGTAPIADPEIH